MSLFIIKTGSDKAFSFTDDASPDTRKTKRRNVSISGQVRRQNFRNSLNWYYEFLFLCRHIKGEVKGRPHVVNAYKTLSTYSRTKIWETLKEVQINITDPLPYQVETESLYKKITNKKDTIEMVRQRAISNDPSAKILLEKLNNQTAERILLDAPSRRLSFDIYFAQNPMAIYADEEFANMFPKLPDYEIDISRLKSKSPGAIIRAATEYTAKSASVFTDAIEACFEKPYFHHHPLFNPVFNALRHSHAFDKGNKQYIDLMEDERKEISMQISRRERFNPYGRKSLLKLEGDVESKESYYIQASDFAAGIASHLYEDDGIFTITSHFEYVMFNGKRVSQNDAYEIKKEWLEMDYYR